WGDRLLRSPHPGRGLRQHRRGADRSARRGAAALALRPQVRQLVDRARKRYVGRDAGPALHHRRAGRAHCRHGSGAPPPPRSRGALLGRGMAVVLPRAGVDPRLAALVVMAAMFAGASRALLASVVFAFETTRQPLGLLPLLGGCSVAWLVSAALMKHSIMTER